jgi:hypothetical protein
LRGLLLTDREYVRSNLLTEERYHSSITLVFPLT